MKNKKINIVTYGTYDLFHFGHERLLKRAKKLTNGGKLFVGVSSDNYNSLKGKKSLQSEKLRMEVINSLPYVDVVFLENPKSFKKEEELAAFWKKVWDKYEIDLMVMGSDWEGKFDFVNNYGMKIKYLSRTKGISSTELRKLLESR